MNIKGISEQILAERLSNLDSAKISRLKKNPKAGGRASDEADTSLLSQLMSKSATELKAQREPRADKILAAESTLDKPVKATPQVTETIFRRMISG